MKKNVGSLDRSARLVLGFLLLGAGYWYQSPWGFIGLVPLATGLMNWCPLYIPFGIKTYKADK
ncbi:MAG: DUF2892 domain-containing protein [Bdellovibrionales bacterium]|nr:DUF2892 domain-containing protein [Bdellovibrionales bacterium]